MRRSGIRPRRGHRRREAPQQDATWWEWANTKLWARSGGRCECCGHRITGSAERHHRQRRRDGGDRLANLLLLLPDCHAYWTAHPHLARDRGIIVSAYADDPAQVPVLVGSRSAGQWVTLDDEGGSTPWPPV